jgi:rod shape-determining protein MreC
MQQIINFIFKNKTFLLFLLLFSIALSLIVQSHSYHKSKFINSANFISGGVYGWSSNINQYLDLKPENKKLLEENNRLKSILFNNKKDVNTFKDSTNLHFNYIINAALVYKNSYSSTNNYLLINKGIKDSIKQDLGVITSKGIVGIVDNVSNKYAQVLSILNTTSRINAQLKKSNHFGSLIWDTESSQIVQLIDIPNFAPVVVGDTIITGGQSQIFPKGIPIGSILSFTNDTSGDSYTIQIKLFNDMTNLGHVYIIKNQDKKEVINLLNEQDE